jgi:hypothetical protein
MESRDIDRIKHLANTESVRRLLIRYFIDKGFEHSFDRQLYPASIQDLAMAIPVLANKIEVVPQVLELDMGLNRAVLGWNLFILGNRRMYLGDTFHNNLQDLARMIRQGSIAPPGNGPVARRQTTPKKVVMFITKILSSNEAGYVFLAPPTRDVRNVGEPFAHKQTLMGMPQQFFSRTV